LEGIGAVTPSRRPAKTPISPSAEFIGLMPERLDLEQKPVSLALQASGHNLAHLALIASRKARWLSAAA
jgi:hypothetical protein